MSGSLDADDAERLSADPGTSSGHVLVVDDDERIRALLRRYLVRRGYRATEARDAAHARRLFEALDFDLAVVDVMMPGEDGFALTRWIDGRTPVILLTAKTETESRIHGLELGADDYVTKPFEPKELKLRIDAVLRRANAQPPARAKIIRLGAARFDMERGALTRDGVEIRLTTAEIAMLRFLAKRMNQPVSRAQLLTEVGSEEADGAATERAVDVQVTRLRRKVEDTPREPRFIKTVRGAGYMLTPDGCEE